MPDFRDPYHEVGPEGVPNLDDATASDIVKAKSTFEALANYCELRLAAMDARFDWDIEEATRIERTMERVYKRLPEWARW